MINLEQLINQRNAAEQRLQWINVPCPARSRVQRELDVINGQIARLKSTRPPDSPQGA